MNYQKLIFELNEIGVALSSETNLDKLLDLIIDKIIIFSECDGASLFLKEPESEQLIFKATKTLSLNKDSKNLKEFPVKLELNSIVGYTAIKGEIVNIQNCYQLSKENIPYKFNPHYDELNNYKTISLLSVPMMNKQKEIIGVIQLVNNFDDNKNIIPFPHEIEEIIRSLASQAAVAISNAKLIKQKKRLYKSLVEAFSEAIEKRSPHTSGHSKRVAYIAIMLAQKINETRSIDIKFSKGEIEELKYAALLHDVGKVSVPEKILDKENKLDKGVIDTIKERFEVAKYYYKLNHNLEMVKKLEDDFNFINKKNKPGYTSPEEIQRIIEISKIKYCDINENEYFILKDNEIYCLTEFVKGNFTKEEWYLMQMHVINTYEILKPVPFTDDLKNVVKYAASHHEMLDGSGYPKNLKKENLPYQSRILAVADIFEALTASDRPYKKSMPFDKALSILQFEAKDNHLDNQIVELFISSGLAHEYIEDRDENRIQEKINLLLR